MCTGAQAAPAPWYKWRSKLGTGKICAQTSPGKGWVKLRAPYKDAGCRIPDTPGRRRAVPRAGTHRYSSVAANASSRTRYASSSS